MALGGRLYQKTHEVTGFMDHRENAADPLDVQYAPSHSINLTPNGVLAGIARAATAKVNSLHGQGIAQLGNGLMTEATAADGLIEAFRSEADSFVLAVQWHPEWRVLENPFYHGIFRVFGDACRQRASLRVR